MTQYPPPQTYDLAEMKEIIVRLDLESQLSFLDDLLLAVERSVAEDSTDSPWYVPVADAWSDMHRAYEHYLENPDWEKERDTYWLEEHNA